MTNGDNGDLGLGEPVQEPKMTEPMTGDDAAEFYRQGWHARDAEIAALRQENAELRTKVHQQALAWIEHKRLEQCIKSLTAETERLRKG